MFEIEKEGRKERKGKWLKAIGVRKRVLHGVGPTISNGQAYIGVPVVCISNSRGCLERRFPKLRADTVTIG